MYRRTTLATIYRAWETPKKNRSELKSPDKSKHYFEITPLWTDPLKKQIKTAVEPVFLSPPVDQLTGFGHVSILTMFQHIFSRYGAIDKIDLKENVLKMMGTYDPV